jgi:eukaryotic-like serine/threonine-protein kinase
MAAPRGSSLRVACAALPSGPRFWPPPWRERRTLAAVAGAVLLLAAGVVVAVAAFGGEGKSGSDRPTVSVATVPSVVGLRTARAQAALKRAGLESAVEPKASVRPAGTVLETKPKGGSRVEQGVAILLIVSRGRPPRGETETTATAPAEKEARTEPAETEPEPAPTQTVPTVTDRPGDTVVVEPEPPLSEVPGVLNVGFVDAARLVEDRGYVAETYPVASSKPRGAVIRQQPEPGTALARGRTVRLYVAVGRGSRGAVQLADYTGLPERQARELLYRAGLTVRVRDRNAPSRKLVGVVLAQQPAAGKALPVLSQVTLLVGR